MNIKDAKLKIICSELHVTKEGNLGVVTFWDDVENVKTLEFQRRFIYDILTFSFGKLFIDLEDISLNKSQEKGKGDIFINVHKIVPRFALGVSAEKMAERITEVLKSFKESYFDIISPNPWDFEMILDIDKTTAGNGYVNFFINWNGKTQEILLQEAEDNNKELSQERERAEQERKRD